MTIDWDYRKVRLDIGIREDWDYRLGPEKTGTIEELEKNVNIELD